MARRPSIWSIAAICVALLAPVSASAQDERHGAGEGAEQHYLSAVQLLGQGRYREALDEFDAAISISPEAIFYCNRAVALIKLSEMEAALKSIRTCRSTFVGADEDLAQIDAQALGLGRLVEVVKPTALAVAEEIARGPLDQARPVIVGDDWDLTDYGLVALGLSGTLFATAATLDFLSSDLKSEFVAESRGGNRARYDELKASLEGRKTAFIVLSAVGGVSLVTGAALIGWDLAESQPAVSIVPAAGSGATATLRVRF